MVSKRKPVKPRTRKTAAPMTQIHVVPKGMWSWVIKVDGREICGSRRQQDAEDLAVFLAKFMSKATVKFHDRKGRITEERTFPTSADPRETPG